MLVAAVVLFVIWLLGTAVALAICRVAADADRRGALVRVDTAQDLVIRRAGADILVAD